MRRCLAVELVAAMFVILICARLSSAQQTPKALPTPTATESTLDIVIPDEPRTIDPATLVPERLAQSATIEFDDASLNEVVQWLRDDQQINTIVEERILEDSDVSLADPVTDRLDNEPLYLLLNRLRTLEIDWTYQSGVLRLTSREDADDTVRTQPYPIGDLLDAGIDADDLTDAVRATTEAAWEDVDGIGGSLRVIGDVLFARNSESVQRKVAALLAALQQHGRRTFVYDDPQHFAIREGLAGNVSIDANDEPLTAILSDLTRQTGIDIRIDAAAFRENKIRERVPVSATLREQPLRLVLSALLSSHDLGWILRDRVLWITTTDFVSDAMKAAVYDVRDLCRDQAEAVALQNAISDQADLFRAVVFPRPGTMVVLKTEETLDEVLQLLEDYRMALRSSKRRERPGEDPGEIITRYYRLQSSVATGLAEALPDLIEPGTWQDEEHPDAEGIILQLASGTSVLDAEGYAVVAAEGEASNGAAALVIENSVLIITQSRVIHEEIAELIEKVENGDQPEGMGGGFGGGGLGGGGFGGGFFSTGERE